MSPAGGRTCGRSSLMTTERVIPHSSPPSSQAKVRNVPYLSKTVKCSFSGCPGVDCMCRLCNLLGGDVYV
eukprot:363060-Chlamydomonas_euryale.AAC.2